MKGKLGVHQQQDDAIEGPTPLAAQRIEATSNIPVLVSELYKEAPARLRTKLLECLLRPVGPLAIVTIATGAFAHLLYRLRLSGTPISLNDVDRVSPDHVLELTYYVAQCSPAAIRDVAALIADSPLSVATLSGAALLVAVGAWKDRRRFRIGN